MGLVGDNEAKRAVQLLESLRHESNAGAAKAIVEDALAAANALESRARQLHREIEDAIDHDLDLVVSLTKELRATYFELEQVRDAMNDLRANRPQLFEWIGAQHRRSRGGAIQVTEPPSRRGDSNP